MIASISWWAGTVWLAVAWDPLGWVHEMDWYQAMLWADWFRGIRPYWIDYRLDWVVAGLLVLLVLVIVGRLVRHGRRPVTGKTDPKRSRALAIKTAEHYLATGEPMLAVEAFRSAGQDERALEVLLGLQAWSQAADLAERLGQLDRAAECYQKAKDPGGGRASPVRGRKDRPGG